MHISFISNKNNEFICIQISKKEYEKLIKINKLNWKKKAIEGRKVAEIIIIKYTRQPWGSHL